MTNQVGICSFCGDALQEDNRFCPTCGREVSHALRGNQHETGLPPISPVAGREIYDDFRQSTSPLSRPELVPAHLPATTPEPEPAPANRPAGAGLLLAGLILAAGAFLPWVTNALGDSLNGLHYAGAAIPLLVCGICLAGLGGWSAAKAGGRRVFTAGMAVSAVAVALSALYLAGTHYYLGQQVSEYLPALNREFVRLGAGPYVVTAGAVLGAAGSLFGMRSAAGAVK